MQATTRRLLVPAALIALVTLPAIPGLAGLGVSQGPQEITVFEPGWTVEKVDEQLDFPTNIEFRSGELIVVEAGRDPYSSPYDGQDQGQVRGLTLSGTTVTSQRTLASGLADPLGLAVSPTGDVLFTQYGKVSEIPSATIDQGSPAAADLSWGYPSQTFDFVYVPLTGTYVQGSVGEAGQGVEANTTGPMGLATRADGEVFLTEAIHGTPPDPVLVRDHTSVDYDNPYSSSVIHVPDGKVSPGDVAARACRNCFELAFAPDNSPFAGELFATENTGVYRARAAAGEDRTAIEGSTATDNAAVDGVNHVDLGTGQISRVATIVPTEPGTGGMAATGLAFAPDETTGHGGELFLTLMSGFTAMTNDRGYVTIAHPDLATGAGTEERLVGGLDFPIDVTFGPDGAMYVIEFYDGELFKLTPPSS